VRVVRTRAERFGAVVATEDPAAIVSIDRALATRIGIDGGALWEGVAPSLSDVAMLEAPNEAHVAVTDRCPAGCRGCYADARAEGNEPTLEEIEARLRGLAELGVLSVALGGGEAALRDDLPRIGEIARQLGMVPTVTTSGLGIDAARARAMRVFAQVNVSHDGIDGGYEAVRGFRGAALAERAIAALVHAGVPVGINTVLTRATFDAIPGTAARAVELGAIEIQLLRFKPSGRGRLDYLAQRLERAQIARLPAMLREISSRAEIGVRIDCSLVPFLSGDPSIRPEDLVRFGVMGCEAGRSLMAMRSDGTIAGCSFWRETAPGVDGATEGRGAWEDDVGLARFRVHHARPAEPCASCALRAACRGGCRIVAAHLTGDPWALDPECPRVVAHRA
jgi:radical SAM protein with 4Fe4S-binding SPASM domain